MRKPISIEGILSEKLKEKGFSNNEEIPLNGELVVGVEKPIEIKWNCPCCGHKNIERLEFLNNLLGNKIMSECDSCKQPVILVM